MKNLQILKTDILKQANVFDLVLCALRGILDKKGSGGGLCCPDSIGPYSLVSKIKKANGYNNYALGIYRDTEGKKVFIKTWHGRTKNFLYYSLINEYNMAKILSEKFQFVSSDIKFRIPRPIGYLATQNSFSVLFEYIQGEPLSKSSVEKQAMIINQAILWLDEIGSALNKEDKKNIKKRDRLFYVVSLPIISLKSFILEKESKKVIFYSFLNSYFKLNSLFHSRLTLVHGDLSPDNIISSGSRYYIIDLEHTQYTLAEYDLSRLLVGMRRASILLSILKKSKNIRQNIFLCSYIAMQFSIFDDPKTKQRPFYQFLKNNL